MCSINTSCQCHIVSKGLTSSFYHIVIIFKQNFKSHLCILPEVSHLEIFGTSLPNNSKRTCVLLQHTGISAAHLHLCVTLAVLHFDKYSGSSVTRILNVCQDVVNPSYTDKPKEQQSEAPLRGHTETLWWWVKRNNVSLEGPEFYASSRCQFVLLGMSHLFWNFWFETLLALKKEAMRAD